MLKPGQSFSRQDVLDLYTGKISKWSIPDDVVVVPELPHTATGKLQKNAIRQIVLDEYARRSPDEALGG